MTITGRSAASTLPIALLVLASALYPAACGSSSSAAPPDMGMGGSSAGGDPGTGTGGGGVSGSGGQGGMGGSDLPTFGEPCRIVDTVPTCAEGLICIEFGPVQGAGLMCTKKCATQGSACPGPNAQIAATCGAEYQLSPESSRVCQFFCDSSAPKCEGETTCKPGFDGKSQCLPTG